MAGEEDRPMTEYEKERLARIRENEARLQALGIRRIAASPLLQQPSAAVAAAAKRKQKDRSDDADEEYLPSDDGGGEEEEESSSASDQDVEEEEIKTSSRSRQKGKKKKLLNSRNSSTSTFREEDAPVTDFLDNDAALQQAIALSLAESSESSVTVMGAKTSSAGAKGRKGTPCKNNNTSIQDSSKNRKTKKQVRSRIQLSEDDVVAFFFSFDDAGKGYITPWDLERMANVNDFIWTDSEISNMIQCFDSDRDGKILGIASAPFDMINLEDFRAIVSRCNMLQEPGK